MVLVPGVLRHTVNVEVELRDSVHGHVNMNARDEFECTCPLVVLVWKGRKSQSCACDTPASSCQCDQTNCDHDCDDDFFDRDCRVVCVRTFSLQMFHAPVVFAYAQACHVPTSNVEKVQMVSTKAKDRETWYLLEASRTFK